MQEPVYVLHLVTCHGRIMPRLAELLLFGCQHNIKFKKKDYFKLQLLQNH